MADPVVVKFGKAGSAVVRANEAGATIQTSQGEMIVCTVTSLGAGVPTFTVTRGAAEVHRASSFPGHPKAKYQWILTKADGSLPNGKSGFALNLAFAATQYTYAMEHCDEFGGRIRLLKDIDYESADPEDAFSEPILVFAK
jgi:hypothetical protein